MKYFWIIALTMQAVYQNSRELVSQNFIKYLQIDQKIKEIDIINKDCIIFVEVESPFPSIFIRICDENNN